MLEIKPVNPYPTSFNETLRRAREEIDAGYKPPLETKLDSIEPFKVVFIGSPNWCGTIAPPVASFLSSYNFTGKIIAPFFTHGRGGLQNMLGAVKELYPNSIVLNP